VSVSVDVLDLGINNLASLSRGFRNAADVELRLVGDASQAGTPDLLVLPGVGAFGAAVDELRRRGLDEVIASHVASGRALFGVCLGMQLLADSSEETPGVTGLGLIPGTVHKLEASGTARVPHMGWDGVRATEQAGPFTTLGEPVDFYFVHSYAVRPSDESDVLITSEFAGRPFVSGVVRDNVLGMQFHPEKSSRPGARLLSEIVAWSRG
jgi:imidazole glycerol-phosphate synthase subunit HisH